MSDSDDEGNDNIIPITEWPINPSPPSASKKDEDVAEKCATRKIHHSQEYEHCSKVKKVRLESGELPYGNLAGHYDEMQEQEAMVQTRIARWWRKYKQGVETKSMPVTTNPNTTLLWISRTPECQVFLLEEEKSLKFRLQAQHGVTANLYAALASVEDYLGQMDSALTNINKAVALDPNNSEYQWLREKLSRQSRVIEIQSDKQNALETMDLKFPPVSKVDRVSIKDLSEKDFHERYVKTHRPVILLDLVQTITSTPWNLDFVKKIAGSKRVMLKKQVPLSAEWACLEDSRTSTVEEFIDSVTEGETDDYLFDWSLPLHCPELSSTLTVPSYFADNYLCQTSQGSLYRDSWPSLFVAPAGAVSQLHIDAFASSFWMALMEGEKRWTFFPPSDTALLYPRYIHSMDPVFSVNLQEPDLQSHPLLALTHPSQCVLKPGELLYVPNGSAHFVENLTTSLAISSNHVDEANYTQVCEELHINGLVDPRAAELLQQLHSPKFRRRKTDSESLKS
ncbi:uncharacterized protein LOC101859122 isoform X2 [Aplysia californica]|nr:uncharacterized protein LOC101859122 isoform X2 [Aplysia californica]XP_005105775.1 uncharacterized protein LOC101859122 isoform X2 [Aplysia californica]XP_005105776.1 uncharacterized protein LOC101859122 isoform X2 [Aplysia californica]